MTNTDNSVIVRSFFEKLWNDRRIELADQLINPECHTHQLQSGAPVIATPRGPDAIKAHVREWLNGFPDLKFTIEQQVSEDERVASQVVMTGTHKGPWLGIPPTGRTVSIRMMTIHRIRQGKIIEDWVLVESLGLFQQLGALRETPALITEFVQKLQAQH
jgi:steroid delta-isomerase-like uncharacterized protein